MFPTPNCVRRVWTFVPIFLFLLLVPAYALPVIVQGAYEDTRSKACSGVTSCTMAFSAVPAGKLLTMKHISCRISASGSAALFGVDLHMNFRHTWLTPVLVFTGTTRTWYANSDGTRLVEAGIAPTVIVSFAATTSYTVNCVLNGQLTP